MKTILITGGSDGIGKGMVFHYLKEGYHVVAVGSSLDKGQRLVEEAKSINKEQHLSFFQANLSLVKENLRLIKFIKKEFHILDGLVLCAASLKPQSSYIETSEGFEFTFALYYLSRYILCYELKDLLERSDNPIIINVCAPGMKGEVHFEDIQMKENYDGQKAQFHGSRLNDLLAVSFHEKDQVQKIKYVLFNPMAARTPGAQKMAEGNALMRITMNLYYKLMGKDVDDIVDIISKVIKEDDLKLVAYKLNKSVDLSMNTFNKENAKKLDEYTTKQLKMIKENQD